MTEAHVRQLFHDLLEAWNHQDAAAMAACYTSDGSQVGFDGSSINSATEIQKHLAGIFSDHQTAAFVPIVRAVRQLAEGVWLLRAVAGMVPAGGNDINPGTMAVQSLVAVEQDGGWRVALFHNTPAAWPGREGDRQQLLAELRQAFRQSDAA